MLGLLIRHCKQLKQSYSSWKLTTHSEAEGDEGQVIYEADPESFEYINIGTGK